MRSKLIITAASLPLIYVLIVLIAPYLGFPVESKPQIFYLIIGTGALIGVSVLFPGNKGKTLRNFAYIFLFIAILLLEIQVVASSVKKQPIVVIEKCEGILPSPESGVQGPVWNTLHATSCIFTGYFTKDLVKLNFITFIIFYFLLPWVFIYAYTYGLMMGMGLENWFGGSITGKNIVKVLSLVISLYATRVMFGAILLDFLGYGMWGLAGIFIAGFLTQALRHQIEKWERFRVSLRETTERTRRRVNRERNAARELLGLLSDLSYETFNNLFQPGTELHNRLFVHFSQAVQNRLREIYGNFMGESAGRTDEEKRNLWERYKREIENYLTHTFNLRRRFI